MWMTVGNLRVRLDKAQPKEREWLQKYLTFEPATTYGRYREPVPVCMFNVLNNTFPAGFLSMVEKAAARDGISVNVIDNRKPPCEFDANADIAWLRDYQLKAVEIARRRRRGILWLPTGSGKTEIMVGLTRALPCRWLAVVHRSQLADDIASRWEKRTPGLSAGRMLEGTIEVPEDAQLVAATYQSLTYALRTKPRLADMLAAAMPREAREAALRLGGNKRDWAEELLGHAQGVLIDECHTAPAETYTDILTRMRNAYYRIGLSGTPLERTDQRTQHAIATIGPVIYKVEPNLLIKRGVLAKPTIVLATCQQSSARSSWTGVYGDLVVRSTVRNALVKTLVQRATKPAFLFVEQMAHGHLLEKQLLQAGIQVTFVWGVHSVDYRKSIIRRLVSGHFDVIVCSKVFNEGIDVPELRSVILGGGMRSAIATLQRLGRGMRVDRDQYGAIRDGGDRFEVYDVLDTGNRWLEKHARIRRNTYVAQGLETFVEP